LDGYSLAVCAWAGLRTQCGGEGASWSSARLLKARHAAAAMSGWWILSRSQQENQGRSTSPCKHGDYKWLPASKCGAHQRHVIVLKSSSPLVQCRESNLTHGIFLDSRALGRSVRSKQQDLQNLASHLALSSRIILCKRRHNLNETVVRHFISPSRLSS
jgi:hypothetical protein